MVRVERESYIPLNNLDEFDHRSGPSGVEALFDEAPEEDITLEEKYSGASQGELEQLAIESFYDGSTFTRTQARKIDYERINAKPDEAKTREDIICGAIRFVINYVANKHNRLSENTQIVDRIQDGLLNLVEASRGFNHKILIINYIYPQLSNSAIRRERGYDPEINRGDIIRVKGSSYTNQSFFPLRERKQKLDYILGFPVELEDSFFFGYFTQEEIDWFKKHNIEHQSFDETDKEVLEAAGYYEPIEELTEVVPHNGVQLALELLSDDRLRSIVVLRNGLSGEEPYTLAEVGEELGLTRQRVHQIEEVAAKRLRQIPKITDIIQGVA